MIIHSVIPDDVIFPQDINQHEELQDITMEDGVILETRHVSEDIYEVVRIISTDPAHYLEDMYQPGTNLQISISRVIMDDK